MGPTIYIPSTTLLGQNLVSTSIYYYCVGNISSTRVLPSTMYTSTVLSSLLVNILGFKYSIYVVTNQPKFRFNKLYHFMVYITVPIVVCVNKCCLLKLVLSFHGIPVCILHFGTVRSIWLVTGPGCKFYPCYQFRLGTQLGHRVRQVCHLVECSDVP